MIYLSRLLLNPRSRAVRSDLADCHQLHRTILSAFPETPAGAAGAREHLGVLYRVETASRDGGIRLLVQSRIAPKWSGLSADYLRDTAGDGENPACKRVDERYARLSNGMSLLFRLRANPTKRVSRRSENEHDGERWHGRRVELRKEEEKLEWLNRKGEQGGFRPLAVRTNPDVADVRATPGANVTGRRPARPPDQAGQPVGRLTFGSVLFEGRLQITDADQFRQTLGAGIGSGKAYGFGLLSIMPVA